MSFHDSSTHPPSAPAPGWYADPTAPPGRTGQRWWDGTAWTEHVVADPLPGGALQARTPDGVPVAGMGPRVGAFVIDQIIVGVASMLFGLPFLLALFRAYGDFFRATIDAANAGATPPSSLSLYTDIVGPITGFYAVILVVTLTYHAVFLRWKAATPGKLAVGLQVRSWAEPGRLTWTTIARRLAGEYWYLVVALIPFAGFVVGLYVYADNLSALGNPQRRALHDRLAGTVVVSDRAA